MLKIIENDELARETHFRNESASNLRPRIRIVFESDLNGWISSVGRKRVRKRIHWRGGACVWLRVRCALDCVSTLAVDHRAV